MELIDVPLLCSYEKTVLTGTKTPFTFHCLHLSDKMVYLNQAIICGRGGSELDFYQRTHGYAFLKGCCQGKLFSCPIRVQTVLQQ